MFKSYVDNQHGMVLTIPTYTRHNCILLTCIDAFYQMQRINVDISCTLVQCTNPNAFHMLKTPQALPLKIDTSEKSLRLSFCPKLYVKGHVSFKAILTCLVFLPTNPISAVDTIASKFTSITLGDSINPN